MRESPPLAQPATAKRSNIIKGATKGPYIKLEFSLTHRIDLYIVDACNYIIAGSKL